ncbi:MAG: helix-turn-helix domain-containing protein [Oscillospiraceae bacterium]|nr:helix-turn-helix domain-containing protein [Oscillospiraceae bacterium]
MRSIDDIQEQIEIAGRLRMLRNARGFTQKEMAEALNMSYHTYVKLENASHGLTTKNIMKLCKFLNVSADMLLFGRTDNDSINFDEYVKCAELLSNDGVKAIEDSVVLIKKLRGLELSKQVE